MQKERADAAESDALLEVLIAQGCSVEDALRIVHCSDASPGRAPDRRPKGFIASH